MKKIISAAAALAFTLATSTFGIVAAPAQAQTVYYCLAQSAYGYGEFYSANPAYACNRAMYFCRVNTPYYGTCYVTRQGWAY